MKEKRFTLFWKKLLVMNLCLMLILFRIFGMIFGYLTKKSTNISIFPKQTENGYPFFDSINCDIRNLVPIIDYITKEKVNEYNENYDKIIFNSFLNNLKTKECSFLDKLNICKDDKKCFDELNHIKLNVPNNNNENNTFNYHSSINEGKLKIYNLIKIFQNKNEFKNRNNNKIEIEPYYKIISGYYSFLNIKLYEKNINTKNYDILKEITNDEKKVNNLLYLHSLFLKAKSIIYKNKITTKEETMIYINDCLRENDDQLTNKNSLFYSLDKNKEQIIQIFENDVNNIINCVPDFSSRYSYSIDINAIKIMIKIIVGLEEKISNIDKKIFNFFLREFSKSLKSIFIADVEIRQKANIYEQYQPYFAIIYICISFGGFIFLNRYFIKHKDYYSQSSSLLEKYKRDRYNYMHNSKHHQYLARMKEIENKKKEEEMKNKKDSGNKHKDDNNNVIHGDIDKCTKEELEYIKKLANENKGDFVYSK